MSTTLVIPKETRRFLNKPTNDRNAEREENISSGKCKFCAAFPAGLVYSTMAAMFCILLLLSIYAEFVTPFDEEIQDIEEHDGGMPHKDMKTELVKYGIIPDVISEVPATVLEVMYGNHYLIYFGNKVNPEFLAPPPHTVAWPSDEKKFYSLVMIDPDYPSRMNPTEREYLHWLVVNIPDDNRLAGLDVAEYYAPEPEPGSGPHRYIFMVFEQPKGKIDSKEPYSDVYHDKYRKKFNTRKFAEKYGFGHPMAINFFIGERFVQNITTASAPTSFKKKPS